DAGHDSGAKSARLYVRQSAGSPNRIEQRAFAFAGRAHFHKRTELDPCTGLTSDRAPRHGCAAAANCYGDDGSFAYAFHTHLKLSLTASGATSEHARRAWRVRDGTSTQRRRKRT